MVALNHSIRYRQHTECLVYASVLNNYFETDIALPSISRKSL